VELTPRTLDDEAPSSERPARHTRRRWLPLTVLAVVLLGLGALVYKGLSDATLYFRNADEAADQRDSLGTQRFRLQGTVTGEPVEVDGSVSFVVAYNGTSVDVRHEGSPPELFRPGIPVVLEGHWRAGSDVFDSDRIMVKHDESYESKDDYERRIVDAERGGGPGG
jgi:cytochrome c-type biogenesis protein CcmE